MSKQRREPQEAEASTGEPLDDASAVNTENGPGESAPNDSVEGRAYRRFQERGGEHGRDVEDWLEAERELSKKSGE
jgi:hypothetical protein